MKLLIFLLYSQYGLACEYEIILHISKNNLQIIQFSNTWCNNCKSGKVITET